MMRSFLLTMILLSGIATLSGCGNTAETKVTAPPETTSVDIDADRQKQEGVGANVEYGK